MDLPPAHRLLRQSITVSRDEGKAVSSFADGVTLPSLEVGEVDSQGTSVGIRADTFAGPFL